MNEPPSQENPRLRHLKQDDTDRPNLRALILLSIFTGVLTLLKWFPLYVGIQTRLAQAFSSFLEWFSFLSEIFTILT